MNAAPNIQHASQSDIALYKACQESKKDLEQAWIRHLTSAMQYKDSRAWERLGYANWELFCADETNRPAFYAASTYRVYSLSLNFMESLLPVIVSEEDNATLVTIKETDLRALKKRLRDACQDKTLALRSYEAAYQGTGKLLPTEGEIRAAYTVLKQHKDTNTVTLAGVDFALNDDSVKTAIALELHENKKRHEMYIEASSKIINRSLEIEQITGLELIYDYSAVNSRKRASEFRLTWKEEKP